MHIYNDKTGRWEWDGANGISEDDAPPIPTPVVSQPWKRQDDFSRDLRANLERLLPEDDDE